MKCSKRWKIGRTILAFFALIMVAEILYGIAAGFGEFINFCKEFIGV
ncbi:MAG: hypothetical protein HFE71_10385 [Emergencia sp.]|jgi:hypothetical protein|nr:hypothetical protein [Emergencia sp.]